MAFVLQFSGKVGELGGEGAGWAGDGEGSEAFGRAGTVRQSCTWSSLCFFSPAGVASGNKAAGPTSSDTGVFEEELGPGV